jgi:hypothetical protein
MYSSKQAGTGKVCAPEFVSRYLNFSYSALACFGLGMPEPASFILALSFP